ncbi:unnamed protein product [Staurois parvus]|uniref:Uncharacterized protein n=1 Tax=Staurois parvus TaxID=386267 RepID=A0ABN9AKP5_9NEOB|nr:unnamed protein product [Staurois parvus]
MLCPLGGVGIRGAGIHYIESIKFFLATVPFIGFFGCGFSVGEDTGAP